MVRTPFVDKNGLKKGAWSPEEDNLLRSYIERYGHWNWKQLPKFAGLARCGKSCRLRWINYLRPNVKHGKYTKEEEDLVIKLHKQLGNRWSKIAAKLPGRTDNEIKNYWHTHLKKRVDHQQTKTSKKSKRSLIRKSQSHKLQIDNNNNGSTQVIFTNTKFEILESYPLSSKLSETSKLSSLNVETLFAPTNQTNNCMTGAQENNMMLNTCDIIEDLLEGDFWTEPFIIESSQQHDDDLDMNFLEKGLLAPYMSYWDRMDFSAFFKSDRCTVGS